MSKLFVKDFKEGLRIDEYLLVAGVSKGVTNAGATYLNVDLQDNSGNIDAKLWDASEKDIEIVSPGRVIKVAGDILLYRNNLQLRINNASLVEEDEYEVADYVKASPISEEILRDKIALFVKEIDNQILSKLINKILSDYDKEFFTYPAASRIHHEYVGGLASHVLGMLEIAENLVKKHEFINKSLLYSGILIHDLGKTIELSGPVLTHYTEKGKLLGHISIMQAKVYEIAKSLNIEESEEVMLLRHMILSHHGEYEYGSPVLPMIVEAELLTFIDNMDARIDMLDKAMATTEKGEFTGRIFSLENRSFYKPKLD